MRRDHWVDFVDDLYFDVAHAAIQSIRYKQIREEYDLMVLTLRRKYRQQFASEILNCVQEIDDLKSDEISALVERLHKHYKSN